MKLAEDLLVMEDIIIANIGWDSAYAGGGVKSHHTYVVEHGSGAEDFNFQPSIDGLFYGYVRDGSALARFSDRLWTIVFVSKPTEPERLRVVGWYEDAFVGAYRDRPEYAVDADFPWLDDVNRYIFSAITKNAYLVPMQERDALILPQGHRIKSGGIYYAAGGDSTDTDQQASDRLRMANWVRSVLPALRDQSRIDRPSATTIQQFPGITLDEGGDGSGYSQVAESDEHKALKQWACENGESFTGCAGPDGTPEFPLLSGDRVDAAHITHDALWLVEVKSRRSLANDLERGVYQCIKYRAVAQAQPKFVDKAVHVVLLTEQELPQNLQDLAARHSVNLVTHWCGDGEAI